MTELTVIDPLGGRRVHSEHVDERGVPAGVCATDGAGWPCDAVRAVLAAEERRLAQVPSMSIAVDRDCPQCGYPETFVEFEPDRIESGPVVRGCRGCGLRLFQGGAA